LFRRSDAHPAWFHCDNGATFQFLTVQCKYQKYHRGLLSRAEIHQAQDPTMGQATYNGKLTEVLVEGDEYALLALGYGQDLQIARVTFPVTAPDDVVPGCDKLFLGPTPDACIQ
jgi:hypothetical protein